MCRCRWPAQEALELFIEVAEAHPRFLRANLREIAQAMLQVWRRALHSLSEGFDCALALHCVEPSSLTKPPACKLCYVVGFRCSRGWIGRQSVAVDVQTSWS